MSSKEIPYPAPPAKSEWQFLNDLQNPMDIILNWDWESVTPAAHLDLRRGISLQISISDPEALLDTAFLALRRVLEKYSLLNEDGVPCKFSLEDFDDSEAYRFTVEASGINLSAADFEGMRRGIYFLIDKLCASQYPYLPIETIEQKPWLKNRISRCFFGPIKRPPFNHDELLDDFDYYPDEYLNRLAYEGINGLWLTIVFREIAETSFEQKDALAEKRLEKLRRTVQQCRRFGIKIWVFSIEPRWLAVDDPLLIENPEFAGAQVSEGGVHCFCPSSEKAQQYIYESVNDIFKKVPGLAGLINISHGERMTTCLSSVSAITEVERINCPRCSKIPPWHIHHNSVTAMYRGIKDADSSAELISWLYQPQPDMERASWNYELAKSLPEGIILQYNFESGAVKKQLSRVRFGGDYWLSYVGPSHSFQMLASALQQSKAALCAKIQVGCSHEVATVPFVPVPALLFQKYLAMKAQGCTNVMQCWYFGNYPGVMNRAAGKLAFSSLKCSEEEFLHELAEAQWGKYAAEAVQGWKDFSDGYSYYPLSNDMQYYGPLAFGVVWPLYLKVELKPLSPTWKPDFLASGDSIGECLENHSIEEAIRLFELACEKISAAQKRFNSLRQYFQKDFERLQDIAVIEALATQFDSAKNILKFYLLRRELYFAEESASQLQLLEEMKTLITAEMSNSRKMIELCKQDSRLGFHSEAESHLYCESRLEWRIESLQNLLDNDFVEFAQAIQAQKTLPISEFSENAEVYKLNSGWVESPHTRWRIDRSENQDLIVHFEGEHLPCAKDYFWFNCFDSTGTCFPKMIIIEKQGTVIQLHPTAEVKISHEEKIWKAKIHLSALNWNYDEKLEPRFVYIARLGSAKDPEQVYLRYDWPKHNEFPRHRLNLPTYMGNYSGKICD